MPAVSSVLLTGRDAAGRKDRYEKRLTANCLMELLVVGEERVSCAFSGEAAVAEHRFQSRTYRTLLHNERRGMRRVLMLSGA